MSVFSWGANSHGQLGLGFENELCSSPQRLSRVPFNPVAIQSIKGGGGHVLVLDKGGCIFSCGWNNRGQLGIGNIQDQNEFVPVSVESLDGPRVKGIACGWDSSGAVTKDKQLYMWGSNSFQQLGVCQRGFAFVTEPMHVSLPRNEGAIRLSIGLRHAAILTDDNKLYVFGRLRFGDSHPGIIIKLIPFNKGQIYKLQPEINVKQIISGQNHLIMSDGHKILGLGENKYGQVNMFTFDTTIVQIASGWTHNGIVTTVAPGATKEVYLWGRNCYGQVGGDSREVIPAPNKLELADNHRPEELHLGSEHGMLLTDKGAVFTWGWNEHGNCGNGDVENVYQPTLIELPSACIMAGTGAGFCYAICTE